LSLHSTLASSLSMLMVHAPNALDSGAQHGCAGLHKKKC